MKRFAIFLIGMICLLQTQAQQHIATRWDGDKTLMVEYSITPCTPGSDYAYVVTPMLCSSQGDTIVGKSVVWRGKRNVKKLLRERYFDGIEEQLPPYIESTDTATRHFTLTFDVARYPWLTENPLHLCFLNDVEGCCQVEQNRVATAPFIYAPVYEPQMSQVQDRTGMINYLSTREMGYYVYFPLNQATLHRNFRHNAATLDSIVSLVSRMLVGGGTEIKDIQIVGQASPEGPQKRNLWLGEHRAKALRDYICKQIDVPASRFVIVNGGEAWDDFREQIALSQMPERDTLLAIIDGEQDLDVREKRIKQLYGGKTYSYLRDNLLADQRNSGYMHIQYEYITDEVAPIINRAIELIRSGQHAEGLKLLATVEHDDRSLNALGNAYYLVGDTQKAINYLARAASRGDKEAQENLQRIQQLEERKQKLADEVKKMADQ